MNAFYPSMRRLRRDHQFVELIMVALLVGILVGVSFDLITRYIDRATLANQWSDFGIQRVRIAEQFSLSGELIDDVINPNVLDFEHASRGSDKTIAPVEETGLAGRREAQISLLTKQTVRSPGAQNDSLAKETTGPGNTQIQGQWLEALAMVGRQMMGADDGVGRVGLASATTQQAVEPVLMFIAGSVLYQINGRHLRSGNQWSVLELVPLLPPVVDEGLKPIVIGFTCQPDAENATRESGTTTDILQIESTCRPSRPVTNRGKTE